MEMFSPESETAPPLWRASVPVFLGVLARLEAMLRRGEVELGERYSVALDHRPEEKMLTAARQVATAVQFTLRIAYPLAGERVPEVRAPIDAAGLFERIAATRALLTALDPAAFAGADTRTVREQAGFAVLDLPGEVYLHEFGLPNLYFHHAMAHVGLKQAGLALGKADFDGKHDYPEGFSLG